MKLKKGTLLFLLLTCLAYTTLAQTNYELQGSDVTIDGNGMITACSCTFKSNTGGTNLTIPKSVTKDSETITITGIGNKWPGIFQDKNLVSVAFDSDSEVTTIGESAFRRFGDNKKITKLTLPTTLTTIGANAFANNSLTKLTLPTTLTTIVIFAFANNSLTTLTLPPSLESIGRSAFQNNQLTTLTIPNDAQLTTIGNEAFLNNEITKLSLPPLLETIGEKAFYNNSLTTLTIPNDAQLTTIGLSAFQGNDGEDAGGNKIETLTLPPSLMAIGDSAFYNNSLTDVAFNNTNKSQIKSIGSYAFSGNTAKLNDDGITLPDHADGHDVTYKDSNDQVYNQRGVFKNFNSSLIPVIPSSYTLQEGDVTVVGGIITECHCEKFDSKRIIIPVQIGTETITGIGDTSPGVFQDKNLVSVAFASDSEVTTIGGSAFENNQMTELSLPEGLTTIGDFAFWSNQITTLSLPTTLTTIGESAFQNNQITTLSLPTTLTTIGESAFANNQITELTLPTALTTIGDYAFNSNQIGTLSLPPTLTTIGKSAFQNNKLTKVTFEGNENDKSMIRSIGVNAFEGNTNLIPITLPLNGNNNFGGYRDSNGEGHEGATITDFTLGYNALIPYELTVPKDISVNSYGIIVECRCDNFTSRDISIPASITKENGNVVDIVGIGIDVFYTKELTSIIILDGLSSIGFRAFAGNKLTSLALPKSLHYIGSQAFYGNNLTEITFAGDETNIIKIGHGAFAENTVTSINLPSHVQGDDNFRYKDSDGIEYAQGVEFKDFDRSLYVDIPYTLTANDIVVDANGVITKCNCDKFDSRTITIPTTIEKLGSNVTITGIGNEVFANKYLVTLSFSDNSEITTIGARAFQYNSITKLTLPPSLTTIGGWAFQYNEISELTLPPSLTIIGIRAFQNNQISELTLPTTLTIIGASAFQNNQISELTLPTTLTTIGASAFQNNPLPSFILPSVEIEGYRTYWQDGNSENLIAELTINQADFTTFFELVSIEQFTLTVEVNNEEGGSIEPSDDHFVVDKADSPSTQKLTAKPNTGWRFDKWVITGGEDENGNPITVTVDDVDYVDVTVDADKTATAHFVQQVTLTTAVAEQQGGTISANPTPYSDNKYDIKTEVTLTAEPNPDWRFDKWVITSGEDGNGNPITETVDHVNVTVDADKTATAYFVEQVTLTTAVAEQQGGTISANPTPYSDNKYDIKTEVTLTAEPNPNWRFDKWVITSGEDEDGNPITETFDVVGVDVKVDADKTATAHFVEQVTLTLTIKETGASSEVNGLNAGKNKIDKGADFELKATPASGQRFVSWTIDGKTIDYNPHTLTTTEADIGITVTFEAIPLDNQVTLTLDIVGEGSINPSVEPNSVDPDNEMKGMYDIDTEVTLEATPNDGWRFDKWVIGTDESTDNPTDGISMDTDKTATAHFVEGEEEEAITSILTEVVSATPYPNPVTSQITLKAKDGDLIQLFSPKGKQQYSTQHTGNEVHTIDVSTLPVGVYLVRITDAEGNTTTKRIVKK